MKLRNIREENHLSTGPSEHPITPKFQHGNGVLKQTVLVGIVAVIATVCAFIFLSFMTRAQTHFDANWGLSLISAEIYPRSNITQLSDAITLVAAKKALGCLNSTMRLSHYRIEPVPMVLNQDLMQIFENIGRVGKGAFGHGRVLHVVDKPTRSHHAMKIFWPSIEIWLPKTKRWYFDNTIKEVSSIAKISTNQMARPLSTVRSNAMKEAFSSKKLPWHYFHDVTKTVSELLESGATPHVVKPEMTLATKTFLMRWNNIPSDNFFEDAPEGGLHTVVITEWLDGGDIEHNYNQFSRDSHVMFHLQNLHTLRLLERSNIVVRDNACHNRFLTKLRRDHCFRGKALADFDFWKYQVQGIDFYFPAATHVLTLGDFDDWFKIPNFSKLSLKQDSSTSLGALAAKIATNECIQNLTESDAFDILNRFSHKPTNEKVKILDMSPD